MRRLFVAILASLLVATPVFAKTNTVYIYEEDGKIYYDGALFDDRFIIDENMTPVGRDENMNPVGQVYTDYLSVENRTSKGHDIYFQITAEDDPPGAYDLLKHVEMRIYLNDVVFYDGKARGLDYYDQGVNLANAIKLKYFEANETAVMKVETYLDSNYEDVCSPYVDISECEPPMSSKTHWHFYIADEPEPTPGPTPTIEPEEIENNPRTHDSFSIWYVILLGVSLTVLLAATIYDRAKKASKK